MALLLRSASLLLLAIGALAHAQPVGNPLWKISPGQCTRTEFRTALRCAVVRVEAPRLTEETVFVDIALPDGRTIRAHRNRVEKSYGGFAWEGFTEDRSRVALAVFKNVVAGDIEQKDGKVFSLRATAPNRYIVIQVDRSKLKGFEPTSTYLPGVPLRPSATPIKLQGDSQQSPQISAETIPTSVCGPQSTIDLLIVYSPAAEDKASSEAAMITLLIQAVASANSALIASQTTAKLRIVRISRVEYTDDEKGAGYALPILTEGLVPLDAVAALREGVSADLVMLIIHQPDTPSGVSNSLSRDPTPQFREQAFGIVTMAGLDKSGSWYLLHEIGHLLGAGHQDGSFGVHDYSRAQMIAPSASCLGYATITAETPCQVCDRLLIYSTPKGPESCGQKPGSATADNARTIEEFWPLVAGFYCGPP